ncbi:hypothetical protein BS17DRAFT_78509 [Gyrodon lividus]|nr:hypothetical protein BS17DRAFT_78509 [Gyrodon lividus]
MTDRREMRVLTGEKPHCVTSQRQPSPCATRVNSRSTAAVPPPARAKEQSPVPRPLRRPATAPAKKDSIKKTTPTPTVPPLREETLNAETPRFVPKPLILVQRLREGKLVRGPQVSTVPGSLEITAPTRPSRSLPSRIPRFSRSGSTTSMGQNDVTVKKVLSTGSRIPILPRRKSAITLGVRSDSKNIAVHTSQEKPFVAGKHDDTPPRCGITPAECVAEPVPEVASSPTSTTCSSTPSISIFSSRCATPLSDVSQTTTPTTCNDSFSVEIPESPRSHYVRVLRGSRGHIQLKPRPKISEESHHAPPTPSLSSAKVALKGPAFAGASLAKLMVESLGMIKLKTRGPLAEVSNAVRSSTTSPSKTVTALLMASPAKVMMESSGTIKLDTRAPLPEAQAIFRLPSISPSKVAAASPIASLAKVMMESSCTIMLKNQAPLPEISNTAAAAVSPLPLTGYRTISPRAAPGSPASVDNDCSRIRKLYIPPLAEGSKASNNPMTQVEIETLRAQRKVAGGGVMDARLERLGSLSAVATVTKLRARFERK